MKGQIDIRSTQHGQFNECEGKLLEEDWLEDEREKGVTQIAGLFDVRLEKRWRLKCL